MAKDPYLYYRVEARELLDGLTRGVLAFEKNGGTRDDLAGVLRLAHTLKGASRVVKQIAIAELAHNVESVLEPYRDGAGHFPDTIVAELLRLLDLVGEKLATLDKAPAVPAAKPVPQPAEKKPDPPSASPPPGELQKNAVPRESRPAFDELFQTVRVEVQDLDNLLERVNQLGVQVSQLQREARMFERTQTVSAALVERLASPRRLEPLQFNALGASAQELRDTLQNGARRMQAALQKSQAEIEQLSELASHIRLLPVALLFDSLARTARDTAHRLDKRIELSFTGGNLGVDAQVLMALRDALLHVVTNAVAHGIENTEQRLKAGKPAVGKLEFTVERRGQNLRILCRDDGRGIDTKALRAAVLRRAQAGATDVDKMSDDEVLRLLLNGGLSTAGAVTEVSGRGVGMDVVRETMERLKGGVELRTDSGRGTELEFHVPISLASLAVLLLDCNGETLALPLQAVRKTIHLRQDELLTSNGKTTVLVDGAALPFLPLATVLKRGSQNNPRKAYSALVLAAGHNDVVTGVDGFAGVANLVVRTLPPHAVVDPIVAGVALDSDGNPRLVLDPKSVIDAVQAATGLASELGPALRPPVLIVDDSLTTRMLEKSILESAGYAVDVAASGEEAMEKLHDARYSLFLVDVEMPGMNGFELLERLREDAALRDIPSILVTSLSSPEDRRRGAAAGAKAYILKSEFDQNFLLETIRRLIG